MREIKNVKVPEFGGRKYKEDSWNVLEFSSLKEFYDYICNTPINKAFRWATLYSSEATKYSENWTGTKSFDEASELFKNGWQLGAKELTQKLKIAETQKEVDMVYKSVLSVCGFQAIVPLYLQGVPNNMVNKKMIPIKNKVITINKTISVSSSVSSETMKAESIKCFQIIKKIEASGIRVNLNLMISTGHACVKIRLKSANEKLNISKLAFPLVHPSMFRRLYFRFVETYPTIPGNFTESYGYVPSEAQFKAVCGKNEIVLPTLLRGESEEDIVRLSVDELIAKLK